MAEVMPQRCPVCTVVALGLHCETSTKWCPWHQCRNNGCRVVLDLAANRGIRPARGAQWVPFRITT